MKKNFNILISFLIVLTLVFFQSCQKDEILPQQNENASLDVVLKKADGTRTFYGPTVPLGNGVARTWVQKDASGEALLEVGVNISAKALENLPDEPVALVLPFHKTKGQGFYNHVLLDWGPEGHEPPGVYDLAHFDVHFYITSVEERMAIGPQNSDPAPDPKYIPEFYLQLPGVVPEMGSHWIDLLSPELDPVSPEVFTHTFILGSFNGELTFWEPMLTLDFLLGKPDIEVPLRQPSTWQHDGWYPTGYRITWSENPGTYTIALTGLTWRQGE